MNYSLNSDDWETPDDTGPHESQVFHQIEETIAKSRKVVEASIALTRKNNERREQLNERIRRLPTFADSSSPRIQSFPDPSLTAESISPLSQKLKEEENLRKEHERTILDLKSRVGLLESKQRVLSDSPRVSTTGQLKQRLMTALSQRDEFREEARLLREAIHDFEDLQAHSSTAAGLESTIASLEKDLEDEIGVSAKLNRQLAEAQGPGRAENAWKIDSMEEKLTTLEEMYQAQVRLNHELESRLLTFKPKGKAVLGEVSKLVSDHDLKVEQLQRRLEDTENQCARLREVINGEEHYESVESVIRKSDDSEGCLRLDTTKKSKKKANKRPETAKKRPKTTAEKPPVRGKR